MLEFGSHSCIYFFVPSSLNNTTLHKHHPRFMVMAKHANCTYNVFSHYSWLNMKGNLYLFLPEQRLFHWGFQTWWQIQFCSSRLLLSHFIPRLFRLGKTKQAKECFFCFVSTHAAQCWCTRQSVHASLLNHTLGSQLASNQTLEEKEEKRVEFWKGFSLLWQCCGLV